jgi:hypothetical protein
VKFGTSYSPKVWFCGLLEPLPSRSPFLPGHTALAARHTDFTSPPSMRSTVLVIQRAAGETTNAITSAISSASPKRLMPACLRNCRAVHGASFLPRHGLALVVEVPQARLAASRCQRISYARNALLHANTCVRSSHIRPDPSLDRPRPGFVHREHVERHKIATGYSEPPCWRDRLPTRLFRSGRRYPCLRT